MSKTFLVVILVVVISVFGVVSYFALVKRPIETAEQTDSSVQNPVKFQTSTLASTSQNETASWKTYRNDTYGFEFKYPESFIANEGLYCEYPAGDGEARTAGYRSPPPVVFEAGSSVKLEFRTSTSSYLRDEGFQPIYNSVVDVGRGCNGFLLAVRIENPPSNFIDLKGYLESTIKRGISSRQFSANDVKFQDYTIGDTKGFLITIRDRTNEFYFLKDKRFFELNFIAASGQDNFYYNPIRSDSHKFTDITFGQKFLDPTLASFKIF